MGVVRGVRRDMPFNSSAPGHARDERRVRSLSQDAAGRNVRLSQASLVSKTSFTWDSHEPNNVGVDKVEYIQR